MRERRLKLMNQKYYRQLQCVTKDKAPTFVYTNTELLIIVKIKKGKVDRKYKEIWKLLLINHFKIL